MATSREHARSIRGFVHNPIFFQILLLLVSALVFPVAASAVTTEVAGTARSFPSLGIQVAAGDQVTLSATGVVCLDAACLNSATPRGSGHGQAPAGFKLPGAPQHGLVCGIGGQLPEDLFYVGQHYSLQATRSGPMFCGLNDVDSAQAFSDNTGSWTLTVVVNGLPRTRLDGFVAAFYDHVLGRSPTAPELAAWVDFLEQSASQSAAGNLVRAFLDGPEYQSRPVTAASHVEALYELVLGRASEPAGAAGWTREVIRLLNEVLPTFVNSPEFQSRLGGLQDRNAIAATVARLYQLTLGRNGGSGEIAAWTDYVLATGDALGLVNGFFSSDEYTRTPRTLSEHVTILYSALLDRRPAPSETDAWVADLTHRRSSVADGFVTSFEFGHRFAQMVGAPISPDAIGISGTNDSGLTALALHENGDRVVGLTGQGQVVGSVFDSSAGPGATVLAGDNGLPQLVTFNDKVSEAGGQTVVYGNYTTQTVDVVIISPSGGSKSFPGLPLGPSGSPSSAPARSVSTQDAKFSGAKFPGGRPAAVEGPAGVGDTLLASATTLSVASCAIATLTDPVTGSLLVPAAAYICGSQLLDTLTRAHNGQDVVGLTVPLRSTDCAGAASAAACADLIVDLAADQIDSSAATQATVAPQIVTAQNTLEPGAPVPTAVPINVIAGGTGTTTVVPNDPDVGQTHTFAITIAPRQGSATIDAAGRLSFTAASGASGSDSVVVDVTDSGTPSRSGTVAVQVTIAPRPVGAVVITVTSASNGAGITGATVTAGALTQVTNGSGVATFPELPAGAPLQVTASATGFVAGTASVTPVIGATTTRTIALSRVATLSIRKEGTGTGTVSSPAGISCGGVCTATFNSDTTVTLTATPDAGSSFDGWSGGGCSDRGSCNVLVSGAVTVTARFTAGPALTVNTTGAGTVTSAPAGIDCGSSCTASFSSGTSVTLTAAPSSGFTFGGWSGGCVSNATSCTFVLSANTTVTATFNPVVPPEPVTLRIQRLGAGTGTVTSDPAAINCGATCEIILPAGTRLTLTAAPASGSRFGGWSGGGCSGRDPCTLSPTVNTLVSAFFDLDTGTVAITVTRASNGTPISGATVTRPGGISQTTGSDGIATFTGVPVGSPVNFTVSAPGFESSSLTVTPVAGSTTFGSISLNASLPPGEFSIVLTWGATPVDLDAHLTGPAPPGSEDERFHIYWDNANDGEFTDGVSDLALPRLDADDVDGNGAETITVPDSARRPGVYRYSVHHFNDVTGTICGGGVSVKVKQGETVIREFFPPRVGCSGRGDLWTVFTVDPATGVFTEVGTITPHVEAALIP